MDCNYCWHSRRDVTAHRLKNIIEDENFRCKKRNNRWNDDEQAVKQNVEENLFLFLVQ